MEIIERDEWKSQREKKPKKYFYSFLVTCFIKSFYLQEFEPSWQPLEQTVSVTISCAKSIH